MESVFCGIFSDVSCWKKRQDLYPSETVLLYSNNRNDCGMNGLNKVIEKFCLNKAEFNSRQIRLYN